MLRVGVLGVGHLGKNHARLYAELPEAQLVGIVDPLRAVAEEKAKELSTADQPVQVFGSPEEMIEHVDAVSVVVPTPQHLAVARPYLEAGKSVLVEKPLAASIEEADELIAAADASGAMLQVGHIERFNPVVNAALPFIDRPLFIECDRIHPFSLRSTDVSVILDLMIHDIDLILHMVEGSLESVDALGARVLSPTDDLATARLVFEKGCVAMVKTSRVALNRSRKIRIFCEKSYLSLDLVERRGTRLALGEGYDPQEFLDEMGRISAPEGEAAFLQKYLKAEELQIEDYEPLKAELQSFLHAAETGEPPKVTGRQGRRAMAAADEIDRSIQYHRNRVEGGR